MAESKMYNQIQSMFDSFLEKEVEIKPSQTRILLPTGIQLLDLVMGGGMATGSMSIFIGRPGCGKSTMGAAIIQTAQKNFAGNLISVYIDSENSMYTERLAQLGVNNPLLKVREAKSMENVFKIIDATCKYLDDKKNKEFSATHPTIIIWDSIANTPVEKELQTNNINETIGLRARMLSSLLPKYISKLSEYNIALISINQLRDKIQMGPFVAPSDLKYLTGTKDMPGGNALKFNAFHIVELREKSPITVESYGFSGVCVSAKCIKNKLFSPNIEIEIVLDYMHGFSDFWTNYNLLKKEKKIVSGAWSYMTELKDVKWHGTSGVVEKLAENQALKDCFDKTVKEVLAELKNKYSVYNLDASKDDEGTEQIVDSEEVISSNFISSDSSPIVEAALNPN